MVVVLNCVFASYSDCLLFLLQLLLLLVVGLLRLPCCLGVWCWFAGLSVSHEKC